MVEQQANKLNEFLKFKKDHEQDCVHKEPLHLHEEEKSLSNTTGLIFKNPSINSILESVNNSCCNQLQNDGGSSPSTNAGPSNKFS